MALKRYQLAQGIGEEEEDPAGGGPRTVLVADSGRTAGCSAPASPPGERRGVGKAREQRQPAQLHIPGAPAALARLPPAGNGLPRRKKLSESRKTTRMMSPHTQTA